MQAETYISSGYITVPTLGASTNMYLNLGFIPDYVKAIHQNVGDGEFGVIEWYRKGADGVSDLEVVIYQDDLATSGNILAVRSGSSCAMAVWDPGSTIADEPSGSATSTSSNKLVDTAATFISDGVAVGHVVENTTDSTTAKVTSVDSQTQVSLDTDIFTSGESYRFQTRKLTITKRQGIDITLANWTTLAAADVITYRALRYEKPLATPAVTVA